MRARLAAFAALATLAGCGSSPPAVLLTVDAVAPATVRGDYRGPAIRIPAVHLPALLDRAEFVRQVTAGQAQIDDFARWAAPLGLLARDALVRDLTARLPAGSVLPPGSASDPKRTISYDVTILSFDAGANGATMQAAFRALPNGVVRQVTLMVPAAADTRPVTSAQALSTLTGQLADRIAADLS